MIEAPPASENLAPASDNRGQQQAAFLHSVAHELSTPLTPLVGYLENPPVAQARAFD